MNPGLNHPNESEHHILQIRKSKCWTAVALCTVNDNCCNPIQLKDIFQEEKAFSLLPWIWQTWRGILQALLKNHLLISVLIPKESLSIDNFHFAPLLCPTLQLSYQILLRSWIKITCPIPSVPIWHIQILRKELPITKHNQQASDWIIRQLSGWQVVLNPEKHYYFCNYQKSRSSWTS